MLMDSRESFILFGIIFIWLGSLSVLLYRFLSHYRRLTQGVEKKDLKSILDKIIHDSEKTAKNSDSLGSELGKIKEKNLYNIQKIGLVRFNPFADTGGDQSFCLSILDGKDSGLVISSLHSRDTTRIYAKPVKDGKTAGYEFSDEEKLSIKKAKKIK